MSTNVRLLKQNGKALKPAFIFDVDHSKLKAYVVRVTVSSGCWSSRNGKMTVTTMTEVFGDDAKKCLTVAQADRKARIKHFTDHNMEVPDYRAVTPAGLKKLEKLKEENTKQRREGAGKRAAETRKKRGTQAKFILCPTCGAKSKKLFSEMGGLQTRRCRNGHSFEVDMFFGFELNKRRVANTDRPLYTGPTSYNDYVYGEFKDNPTGK